MITTSFYATLTFKKMIQGEKMVKGARGAKVKILLQGLHMTCVIFVLVYNLKICISNTPFHIALLI
jgi:hypothetical protein